MCCSNGKVILQPLPQPPILLKRLLCNTDPQSIRFRSHTRAYNSCFQMTSFGAKNIVRYPGYMPTFKIQGQVYHSVGSVTPPSHQQPCFLQIYFIENYEQQALRRVAVQSDAVRHIIDRTLLAQLQSMLHIVNPYIRDFKTAFEKGLINDSHKIVIRADKRPPGQHPRRYNAPSCSEIAALLINENAGHRDIVLHAKDDKIHRVSETNRAYDSWQYPLLFPRGEDGYHLETYLSNPQTKRPTSKKMSPLQFYAYRLMQRENEFNILHRSGPLSHQFIVDAYAKIESERLSFIRYSQDTLRVDKYSRLRDTVHRADDVESIGRTVVLPSTFTGSPRYMHERFQDTMTYVRKFGAPDLFTTMTCNPRCSEIENELFEGQSPADRQDITARVFKQKVEKLMDLMDHKEIFGKVRCHAYAIEWQKRGLPHIHLLTWLYEKVRPDDIDKVISAELPDPEADPILYELVKKHMVHGPCGERNMSSPCMENGRCTKKYPRDFASETQTGENGYPLYRRRSPDQGGNTAELSPGRTVDNRWIVPYNPFLLRTFKCHINVEISNSVKSVKYICKYVHKGQDMAVFGVRPQDTNDEITCFQAARYISTNEAVWRICAFPIHHHHPAVQKLHVHLENGQRVTFNAENAADQAEQPPKTTLTEFFALCQKDAFARTLLYVDVPKYYTWQSKSWRRRQRGQCVEGYPLIYESDCLGRVYTVHPNDTECYHLRLLLHTVRGPTSFEALRTFNETVYPTYQEACKHRGLLESDDHWHNALTEAAVSQMPRNLRDMFAIMLHMCSVADPPALWEAHKEPMSEDFLHRRRQLLSQNDLPFSDILFNQALIYIEDKLLSFPSGKPLSHYGIQSPDRSSQGIADNTPQEILAELSYNLREMNHIIETRTPTLSPDQHEAYDAICSNITETDQPLTGRIIFLDAPGGTGKTYLLNLLLAKVRASGQIALAVASSGIAATLLQGGKTAHSTFKLPLDLSKEDHPSCNIERGTVKARLLQRTKLIVWDECTMTHRRALEALDRTLRDIRQNDTLMGGLTLLLAGDFRQTLPIVPRGTRLDQLQASLKASRTLWPTVRTLHLRTNMRVHLENDVLAGQYADLLLRIGNGEIPTDECNFLEIPYGNPIYSPEQLENAVFPDLAANFTDQSWLSKRAILAPTNDAIATINDSLLDQIPTELKEYPSMDTPVDDDGAVLFPTELLNSLDPPGFPPHILRLKKGVPVILLRNLDAPKLCNGTKLIIHELRHNVIEAIIALGQHQGQHVFIFRIPLIPTDTTIPFRRLQFPIRLSFAMTINKAQGQTLDIVGLSLLTHCFSHGQFYVACSRVHSPHNLYVLTHDNKTKNIVYHEIFH